MIEIKNLKVNVGEKEILKGINLDFELGKNYLILGRNGSGKSSISQFLMGNKTYSYVSGDVKIDDIDLNLLNVSDRSKKGLFLSFQNVPEIQGVNLGEYLRIIYNNSKISEDFKGLSPFLFKRFVKKYLDLLEIPEIFLNRDLNVGFSGGEKRKIEILQALLLNPKYIILDEIDSGLDIDAFKVVSNLIGKLDNKDNSIIIITHHFKIIEYINIDKVYILKDGKIDKFGDKELVNEIIENGFE